MRADKSRGLLTGVCSGFTPIIITDNDRLILASHSQMRFSTLEMIPDGYGSAMEMTDVLEMQRGELKCWPERR